MDLPQAKMSHWLEPELVRAFAAERTDAYRLCTFEDGWVERYGSDVLISYKSDTAQERLTTELYLWSMKCELKFSRVFARFLPRQNAERQSPRLVAGEAGESLETIAMERSLNYGISFETGYSVGLFIDQRENRSYVRICKPKTLLNCFAYTCAFSAAAATVGTRTLNIDLSKKSLARGRENFEHNGLSSARHGFIADDVMEVLPRLARKGEKFEFIILDPPTFSRSHRGKAFQVERDFETLLLAALDVAEREAHILLSTNCATLDEHGLEVMARFCLKAARRAGNLQRQPRPADFPPETGASTVWLNLR